MIYFSVGVCICILALFVMSRRREKPWPREGHGATYFARPALRQ